MKTIAKAFIFTLPTNYKETTQRIFFVFSLGAAFLSCACAGVALSVASPIVIKIGLMAALSTLCFYPDRILPAPIMIAVLMTMFWGILSWLIAEIANDWHFCYPDKFCFLWLTLPVGVIAYDHPNLWKTFMCGVVVGSLLSVLASLYYVAFGIPLVGDFEPSSAYKGILHYGLSGNHIESGSGLALAACLGLVAFCAEKKVSPERVATHNRLNQ